MSYWYHRPTHLTPIVESYDSEDSDSDIRPSVICDAPVIHVDEHHQNIDRLYYEYDKKLLTGIFYGFVCGACIGFVAGVCFKKSRK